MSEHRAEVVRFELEKHDNADELSIAKVRGWQCVVRTEDFKNEKLGIYIPIDMVVPNTPEWEFLGGSLRIKTRKFRGAISQGLLINAKPWHKEGDDVTEELGITRYIPKVPGARSTAMGGSRIADPDGFDKYTDIENWKNYTSVFEDGEMVAITEKIHGANFRCGVVDGRFYVGSHNTTRKPIQDRSAWYYRLVDWFLKLINKYEAPKSPDAWTKIAIDNGLEAKLQQFASGISHIPVVLYGEIYGPSVQKLDYGVPDGKTEVRFFDLKIAKDFLPWNEFKDFCEVFELPTVPELAIIPWSRDVFKYVDGKAFSGNHVREGIVVRPAASEQRLPFLGRKILKLISEKYLLKDYEEYPDDEEPSTN